MPMNPWIAAALIFFTLFGVPLIFGRHRRKQNFAQDAAVGKWLECKERERLEDIGISFK